MRLLEFPASSPSIDMPNPTGISDKKVSKNIHIQGLSILEGCD